MNIENARIYAPAEDSSKPAERTILHPETNIDQVLTTGNKTLRDDIGGKTIFGNLEEGDTVEKLGRDILHFRVTGNAKKITI